MGHHECGMTIHDIGGLEVATNTRSPAPTSYVSIPSSDDTSAARDRLLEKITEDADLPALGTSVARVVQLASSDDEAVRNLAHFVLSDVALTQKILRLSNSVCYRTSGTPVTTISKAIFMLGFDTVKTSALAMLLVDGMSGKRGQSVRAELQHALSASIVGRELARRSHFKDAEEAAVAALFKNMGRLLVAAHDHFLYREIVALIEDGTHTPSQASMKVLGCSFEMLADSVLQEWQIPDTIIQSLKPLPQGVLKPAKTRQEWMQQVAAFSTAAATLIPNMNAPGQDASSRALLVRFGAALNLDQEKLTQLFDTVAQETHVLNDNANLIKLPAAKSGAQAEDSNTAAPVDDEMQEAEDTQFAERAEQGLPTELLLAVADDPRKLQTDARHASGKPLNARDLLMAGVQDVTEMMASGRCKVNDLMMLALETLYRSMGFRFATVCMKDIKTNQFRARISLGESNSARQTGFIFSAVSSRDLFHLAMENDADLMISDASAQKIHDLIPGWHRLLLPDARSFIVLPLVVQKKPFGLFYADRTQIAPEGVPPDETALIKTLKGQVLAALNSR
jgi:HD-like signal output (HDOD) protein